MTRGERRRARERAPAVAPDPRRPRAPGLLEALRRVGLHRVLRAQRRGWAHRRLREAGRPMNPSTLAARDAAAMHERYVLTPWIAQAGRKTPVIVRGEGSYLFDESGARYLDFSAGLVAVNLGHAHPALARAIAEQAHRVAYVAPSLANDRRAELARAI